MARDWRMEYKGAFYHVIARGNNKEYIFEGDGDKGFFVKTIKEALEGGFQLYGYILMDNHYHLLIQRHDKELHTFMHKINNKYSKYFNYKYRRFGHVFQNRYKAILVQDERYLLSLLRYIHRNPVRAGICKNVTDYKWSSNFFYENNRRNFVKIDIVLDMLSTNRSEGIEKYKEFMKAADEDKIDYEKEKFIGDEAYKIMMSSRLKKPVKKRLDEILSDACPTIREFQLIKNGSRKRDLTKYKLEYIKSALEVNYTQKEIGKNIKISDGAVRKLISNVVPQ